MPLSTRGGTIPGGITPGQFATLFKLPPAEALDYLARRNVITETTNWKDVWQEEHLNQFTISRLTNADLLADIQGAITKSVGGDLSRRDWMRDVQQMLTDAGWWGEKEVLDEATGEMVKTVFDPARLRLIYDTNVNNAYSAGLWERIQRNKATSPYIRYITKRDERVRAQHAAWDNLTLGVDDTWWDTHYPPNGFRCRCRAMSMSQAEYDKRKAAGTINTVSPPETITRWVNKRTGEISDLPNGIDPGFAYNVGKARALQAAALQIAGDKAAALPAPIAKAMIGSLTGSDVFATWMQDPHGAWPLAVLPEADVALLGADARVAKMSVDTAVKQLREHPEITAEEYVSAQRVVDNPTAYAVQDNIDRSGVKTGTKSIIYVLDDQAANAGGYVLAVKATLSGRALWVTSYRRLSRDEALKDAEIARVIGGARRR